MYRYIKPHNISSLKANIAMARPRADRLNVPVSADQDTRLDPLDAARRPLPDLRLAWPFCQPLQAQASDLGGRGAPLPPPPSLIVHPASTIILEL